MYIKKTKDYDQFKKLHSQRELKGPRLTKLVKAIQKKNLLEVRPILIDENFYVIDGQTRLAAARQLGVDIYYVTTKDVSEEDMITLNALQDPWRLHDYLNHFSTYLPDYEWIGSKSKEFRIPLHVAVEYASMKDNSFPEFRLGKFSIKRKKEFIERKFKEVSELMEITKSICIDNSGSNFRIMKSFFKLVSIENFDLSKFKKKMENYKDKLLEAFSYRNIKNIFERLEVLYTYNDKTKKAC